MKVFFISETHRADAQTWIRGLKEFGNCEVETWEIIPRKGALSRFWRIWDWLKACFSLRNKIRQSGADILLAERVTSYGFLGAVSGFHPFVIAQQGVTDVWPPQALSAPFKAMLARYAFKKADLIQAWGQVMVPAMIALGANPEKIKVLAKGIDLEKFSFKPEDKKWDKIRAVVTRSLTPDYNHDVILRAARILKDQNIPVEIKIIGDGPLMNHLKQQATELDVNDLILFTGRIPNDLLPKYLSEANMYISVPVTEGVSASLFEAMGSGALPVVTDLPGTEAWIRHGENGYLVPINNSESLATFIIQAFNNKALMQQAILQNRKIAEEHADFRKNMPVFMKWYRELVG
jgi:glycosyltransferase involved in cell wall biosynthesis